MVELSKQEDLNVTDESLKQHFDHFGSTFYGGLLRSRGHALSSVRSIAMRAMLYHTLSAMR